MVTETEALAHLDGSQFLKPFWVFSCAQVRAAVVGCRVSEECFIADITEHFPIADRLIYFQPLCRQWELYCPHQGENYFHFLLPLILAAESDPLRLILDIKAYDSMGFMLG